MRKLIFILFSIPLIGIGQTTPFENSGGKESATYLECIEFYRKMDKVSGKISIRSMGMSDAGYPYQVVLFSNDGQFDPQRWHAGGKIVMLIINGIHPGEPDGIDASMMLLRDLNDGKLKMPDNVVLAIIPVYNIGGALNRNKYSRVNQDGPESFGFRGNSQNLDLNRDFTKCDSRDARSFTTIFHWLNPDIQLDNHVSDGADYQHTMTLISTQWNKLGGRTGEFLHDKFDPELYIKMESAGWPMCPYVNFEEDNPANGWEAFMDYPRYSSGYAALFHTISYISETHMLKPFPERVKSTYALMNALIQSAAEFSSQIRQSRKLDAEEELPANELALKWICDSSKTDAISFKGYTAAYKMSNITGKPRLFYDHTRPFEKKIPYYNYFKADKKIGIPDYYIIPQGWHEVIDLLRLNGVELKRLSKDTLLNVMAYHILDYKSFPKPYEKHHKNYDVRVSSSAEEIQFREGDILIATKQAKKRFLVEMLEPTGDDSYFAWNFFDAILQQKEGYSDYRWEDVAESWLQKNPSIRTEMEEKKRTDSVFSNNPAAQLNFIYKRSPYYEPAHMRYPVYRLSGQH
jgi:hypothetical protein